MGAFRRFLTASFLAATLGIVAYEAFGPSAPPPDSGRQTAPSNTGGRGVPPDTGRGVPLGQTGQAQPPAPATGYVSKRGDAEVASRGLAAGEMLLARGIFGDALDV